MLARLQSQGHGVENLRQGADLITCLYGNGRCRLSGAKFRGCSRQCLERDRHTACQQHRNTDSTNQRIDRNEDGLP